MKMGLPFSISILKPLLVLLAIFSILGCTKGLGKYIERERLALLDFKKSFVPQYPYLEVLSSWKSSEQNCCTWEAITCDNFTRHVISLDLYFQFLKSSQLRPSLVKLHHLRSLNLSGNDFAMRIPEFFSSFKELTDLHLSDAGFFGKIPPYLGNLTNIQTLSLSSAHLSVDSLHWLSNLSSLEDLDMSETNFTKAKDWLSTISRLPLLASFQCERCSLPPPVLSSSAASDQLNSSTSLELLDLSYNILSSSTISWLTNSSSYLSSLTLSDMNSIEWLSHLSTVESLCLYSTNFTSSRDWLSTIIKLPLLDSFQCFDCSFPPIVFSTMASDHVNSSTYLRSLELFDSYLSSSAISWLLNSTTNLSTLVLLGINLDQSLTDILQTLTSCASSSLMSLELSWNNFTGTVPSMLNFPSLMELDLSHNHLKTFSPQNLSPQDSVRLFPASLTHLDLSSNSLNGVLSDVYFTNLSQLTSLDLSDNPNLIVNFSKPPTQVETLRLRSCNLGSNFPNWLLFQTTLAELDISSCNISGSIPIIFWKNLPSSLYYLNISFNSFHDLVPNLPFFFATYFLTIDLTSNAFYGSIPSSFLKANVLLLSKNNFSSFAPLLQSNNFTIITPRIFPSIWDVKDTPSNVLDISSNYLLGVLPDWFWLHLPFLSSLNLANNNLSGVIPDSIGFPSPLFVLSLSNNKFSGSMPLWLKNCSELRILDLSGNRLSGFIPFWMGEEMKNLIVLSLSSNQLMGSVSSNLCHLSFLQILDLSHNRLSEHIPSCVYKLTAMVSDINSTFEIMTFMRKGGFLLSEITRSSFFYAFIKWKGMEQLFEGNLALLKLIDLSHNNLNGEIPTGMTSLLGLKSLDLSSNNLQGSIPAQIGQLKSLEVLNLSFNSLCGQIPSSLSEVSSLAILDFSNNCLWGRIPTGTQLQGFNSSVYAGNPKLCGLPLPIKCPGEGEGSILQPSGADDNNMESKWPDKQCFYAGLGTGFAFGFLIILVTLSLIRKWRYAFFQFASHFTDWILVIAEISSSKISRKLHFK